MTSTDDKVAVDENDILTKLIKEVDISCVMKREIFQITYAWEVHTLQEFVSNANMTSLVSSDFKISGLNGFIFNLTITKNIKPNQNTGSYFPESISGRPDFSCSLKIYNQHLTKAKIHADFIMTNNKLEIIAKSIDKIVLDKIGNEQQCETCFFLIKSIEFSRKNQMTIYCKLKVNAITNNVTDYQTSIVEDVKDDYKRLFDSHDLSDFKITIEDEKFEVHKAILSLRSPVYKAMFLSNMRESNDNEQIVQEKINPKIFYEMLRYMYYGEVENLDKICLDLFSLADYYQLDGLKNKCILSVARNISLDNICDIIDLIETRDLQILKAETIIFLKLNRNMFIQSAAFNKIILSYPTFVKDYISNL